MEGLIMHQLNRTNYHNSTLNHSEKLYNGNMTIYNESDVDLAVTITTPTYLYVWITLVNVIIFIIGSLGNCLVIAVVFKFREMRTSTNWCLINLSISDLLVLAICQSSALTEFFAKDRWLLGDILCK
jgi:hypothetical protein